MDLLLIDAMNLIRRIYAAQQQRAENPAAESELLTQNAILKNIERFSPTHVALVFDATGQTWRHKLYDGYKADRKPMPDDLAQALSSFKRRFESVGIPCVEHSEFEADDIIATLAVKVSKLGGNVQIVSTDKGFMQIVNSHTTLYHHFEKRRLNLDDVKQQLGLFPDQLPDFLALVGDSTNHVPGVPGVGPKTAGQLLDEYQDLDSVLINSQSVKGKVGENLAVYFREALLARKLVSLKLDCPLGINLQTLRYKA